MLPNEILLVDALNVYETKKDRDFIRGIVNLFIKEESFMEVTLTYQTKKAFLKSVDDESPDYFPIIEELNAGPLLEAFNRLVTSELYRELITFSSDLKL
jgi:hypothetical protein